MTAASDRRSAARRPGRRRADRPPLDHDLLSASGASERARLAAELLAWGEPRMRDLPWRQTRDPWAVLVSEVMLQQTQAARVVPRWIAFLERFPDPRACAAAPLADVLTEWQGLGYPRRARNLHATARIVSEAGRFPRHLAGLLALPGVGEYTARAVLAFAFGDDAAVVDTNVARVYARLGGRPLRRRQVQAIADAHLPPGRAWAWNQCLIDLGAEICRAAAPQCDRCPLRARCVWRADPSTGDPAVGSAGVSRPQARFEGSDRQLRGRLLRTLGERPLDEVRAAAVLHCDPDRAARIVASLLADGLCERHEGALRLPSG